MSYVIRAQHDGVSYFLDYPEEKIVALNVAGTPLDLDQHGAPAEYDRIEDALRVARLATANPAGYVWYAVEAGVEDASPIFSVLNVPDSAEGDSADDPEAAPATDVVLPVEQRGMGNAAQSE